MTLLRQRRHSLAVVMAVTCSKSSLRLCRRAAAMCHSVALRPCVVVVGSRPCVIVLALLVVQALKVGQVTAPREAMRVLEQELRYTVIHWLLVPRTADTSEPRTCESVTV